MLWMHYVLDVLCYGCTMSWTYYVLDALSPGGTIPVMLPPLLTRLTALLQDRLATLKLPPPVCTIGQAHTF